MRYVDARAHHIGDERVVVVLVEEEAALQGEHRVRVDDVEEEVREDHVEQGDGEHKEENGGGEGSFARRGYHEQARAFRDVGQAAAHRRDQALALEAEQRAYPREGEHAEEGAWAMEQGREQGRLDGGGGGGGGGC